MHVQLIRCIKAFCPDFQPIRHILTSLGATCVEQKEQIDYFFWLPIRADAPASRRLKLRVENQQPRWIYYYDRSQDSSSLVTFQRFEVCDPIIKDILATALGIKTVVQKQREVWRLPQMICNLDHLDGVGQIFEMELEVTDQDQHVHQAEYYQRLFQPYLGAAVHGSNEDLVPTQPTEADVT